MKRFYREVSLSEDFCVLLDGKPVRTPRRAKLALPTRALGEAVGAEWRAQGDKVDPFSMPLTKLANTAIDRVVGHEEETAAQVLSYVNDLLCYRAATPAELVARQTAHWNPLLDWAAQRHGAWLNTGSLIIHIDQPAESVEALRRALSGYEAFALTALHSAATICGSLVLALALAEERLDAQEAFALCQLDERFQAEKWGVDGEAAKRSAALARELDAAARFLALTRG